MYRRTRAEPLKIATRSGKDVPWNVRRTVIVFTKDASFMLFITLRLNLRALITLHSLLWGPTASIFSRISSTEMFCGIELMTPWQVTKLDGMMAIRLFDFRIRSTSSLFADLPQFITTLTLPRPLGLMSVIFSGYRGWSKRPTDTWFSSLKRSEI